MRVEKTIKIIYFWMISFCNFWIGVNVMYCIANPEVGLWRIPLIIIGIIALDILAYPIITAKEVRKEGA